MERILEQHADHSSGWAPPWFLVFPVFLFCRYPGIVLPVGVAPQQDPHMFEREALHSDRRSRLSHTADYWCRGIQPVQSGCLSQRKK